MALLKNNYVYGSAAERIQYDPYEENAVLKSKKKARNNARIKIKIVLYIMVVFGMFASIMFRYAQISQLNYDNNNLNKEYVRLQNENALIALEIKKAMDLNNIREIAENELAMHQPDKSQIVYVSIPKKDVTIVANKTQSPVSSMFTDLGDHIKKFLNLLY